MTFVAADRVKDPGAAAACGSRANSGARRYALHSPAVLRRQRSLLTRCKRTRHYSLDGPDGGGPDSAQPCGPPDGLAPSGRFRENKPFCDGTHNKIGFTAPLVEIEVGLQS